MKKIIIVDLDGTVFNISHRVKYLENKNFDLFYSPELIMEDKPIKKIIEIVKELSSKYRIVFCTGRPERTRNITSIMIDNYIKLFNYELLMRSDNDRREDYISKPKLLIKAGITPNDVLMILEDRKSVVDKWRELGYTCLQVADGDF